MPSLARTFPSTSLSASANWSPSTSGSGRCFCRYLIVCLPTPIAQWNSFWRIGGALATPVMILPYTRSNTRGAAGRKPGRVSPRSSATVAIDESTTLQV
jgi:hypothetical protein